jgi:protein-tyrosine phosphatase
MDWITDKIAIGNYIDALDPEVLRQFQSILSLIPILQEVREGNEERLAILRAIMEEPEANQFDARIEAVQRELDRKRLEVFELIDGPGNDMSIFKMAVHTLAEMVQQAPPVLVHCHAGRSRSPVVVAGYLMLARGLGAHDALNLISTKRDIFVQDSLASLLDMFE